MNKTIWTFWESDNKDINQNILINKCIESWRYHCKDWNIIILNNDNIMFYINEIPIINNSLEWNKYLILSDFLRVYLVYMYGGVWMDVSIFLTENINYFFKDKEKSCILFKEFFDDNNFVICSWLVGSLYPNHTFLGKCLDDIYSFLLDPIKYKNKNNEYLRNLNILEIIEKWQSNFCLFVNSTSIYDNEDYFWIYLIFLKVFWIDKIQDNLIFYNPYNYGRFHKKLDVDFNKIIKKMSINNYKINKLIKFCSSERKLIIDNLISGNYQKNSIIDIILRFGN